MIEFTILGEPKAKQRPRHTKKGFTYTPKQTVNYENYVKLCYQQSKEENGFEKLDGMIRAIITCYFSIPKSFSKKKREKAIQEKIRPTKKPDLDNIAKSILDSLNDIAFDDDKQVVTLLVNKFYSENPRVEVILQEARYD